MADCSQMRVSSCILFCLDWAESAVLPNRQIQCPAYLFSLWRFNFWDSKLLRLLSFQIDFTSFLEKKIILYFVQDLTKLDANWYIWFAPVLINYFKTSAVPMEHKNHKWDYQSQATRWGKSKISKTLNISSMGCYNMWICHITQKFCQT